MYMDIKLWDIVKQPVIQNPQEFQVFLNRIESLDRNISIRPISREFYEYKHQEWEDILEQYIRAGDKSLEYTVYIPYDFAYGDIVYIVDLITKKLGTKEYFTNNWFASRIKTQLAHIFGKNWISPEETTHIQATYHISDETVKRILKAPISLREMKNITGKIDKIEALKNTARIWLDSIFLDKWKQALGDFMMTFTKDDYDILPSWVKDNVKKKYWVNSDEEVKNYLNDIEENLWNKIEKEYKKQKSLWEGNLQKNIVDIIAIEVQKFPRQEWNIDDLTNLLKNKDTQCLMKCFLSHILLSRLWIKHTVFTTEQHIQLIVYLWEETLLLDTTNNEPILKIGKKTNSLMYFNATEIEIPFVVFGIPLNCDNYTGYEKETNIWLLCSLYNNKAVNAKNSRYYDLAIELSPDDRSLYFNRAVFYLNTDNIKKTRDDLEKARNDIEKYVSLHSKEMQSNKDIVYLYKSLAWKYILLQQHEKALEVLQELDKLL